MVVAAVAGAAPQPASRDDRVVLSLPNRFIVGGSPRPVNLTVTKYTEGCVSVRTTLAVRMSDLTADQLDVRVEAGEGWRRLPVSPGPDDLLVTERLSPQRHTVCSPGSVRIRYRVGFLDSARTGRATVIGEAYAVDGDRIGRAAGERRVVTRKKPPSSPSPLPSVSPSSDPAPTAGSS